MKNIILLLVSVFLVAGAYRASGNTKVSGHKPELHKGISGVLVHPDDVYWDTSFHYPRHVNYYGPATVHNGTLYIVCYGVYKDNGADDAVLSWSENNGWQIVCTGIPKEVTAIATDGTNIYLGGSFDEVQGVPAKNVVKWNSNKGWKALGAGLEADHPLEICIFSLAVTDNGTLYAGGTFTKSGDWDVVAIAWWDGLSWEALGNITAGVCRAIAVDGNNVYTGSFREEVPTAPDGHIIHTLSRWDGEAWHSVGENLQGEPHAIVARDGALYVAGLLTMDGEPGGACVMHWDGSRWNRIGGRFSHIDNPMGTLALTASGDLYIHGSSWEGEMEQFNGIAHWDGTVWQGLANGIERGGIRNLQAVGDDVIAIGTILLQVGGKKTEGTARWRKLTTSVLEHSPYPAPAVSLFPNPALYFTAVQLTLEQDMPLHISLYSSTGELVAVLCDQFLSRGIHRFNHNITQLGNGVYYYRINTGTTVTTYPLVVHR